MSNHLYINALNTFSKLNKLENIHDSDIIEEFKKNYTSIQLIEILKVHELKIKSNISKIVLKYLIIFSAVLILLFLFLVILDFVFNNSTFFKLNETYSTLSYFLFCVIVTLIVINIQITDRFKSIVEKALKK